VSKPPLPGLPDLGHAEETVDEKKAPATPASAPAPKAEEKNDSKPAAPEPKPYTPVAKDPAPASAPTLVEGRVDEWAELRNEQGQLAPEDGKAADPLTEELKDKFSGEGGGTF
jgi:hypothetical protein